MKYRTLTFFIAHFALAAHATPFRPANDSVIVEKLPRSLIALRKQAVILEPKDIADAIRVAREYLQIAQRTSDPSFVRYAEQVLNRFEGKDNPDVLYLQAVILQHRHDFAGALEMLDQVPRINSQREDIALLRAAILTTVGRPADAKRVFAADLRLTSTLEGMTIFLNAASLSGALARSEAALARALTDKAPAAQQAFAWCSHAEMAVRRGDSAGAETSFRKAMALDPGNSYILAAYADTLLAADRKAEAIALIPAESTSEALLARRTLALGVRWPELEAQLRSSGHFRELALLQLRFDSPQVALESAARNWAAQKEPIDAILLVRAALASHHFDAAAPAVGWIKSNHLEDKRLEPLLRAIETCS